MEHYSELKMTDKILLFIFRYLAQFYFNAKNEIVTSVELLTVFVVVHKMCAFNQLILNRRAIPHYEYLLWNIICSYLIF